MNTLIAALLGIFHIILFFDNMKILLLLDNIRNPVDVVAEKAHDPDAGDVIECLHRLLKGDFPPFLFEFFDDAVRRLDAAGHIANDLAVALFRQVSIDHS